MGEGADTPVSIGEKQLAQFAAEAETIINELASFGAEADGGVTRLLYSEAWRGGQEALAGRMRRMGLEVRQDQAGNVFGRLTGMNAAAPSILTGSHVDTVRCGGSYDGIYGIAAGLIALRYLKLTCGQPQRSLEAVSFCEEEGSRFPIAFWGSGSITGFRGEEHIRGIYDDNGIAFREAMEAAGFGNPQQPASRRDDIAAFIELHVEQGVILERMEQTIGIVDAIVGQKRYVIELSGEANHAGTTPMRMRKDALSGAAEMIVYLEQEALRLGEPLVATVGKIEAVPNTSNVIAGKVTFTLDIRHPGEAELGSFCGAVLTRFDEIAHIRGLSMDCRKSLDVAPARMDHGLSHRLEQICQAKSLSYRRMVSGAGHDAQVFQRYCPTALLFVPSCRGISHSPEEYTLPQDMAAGIAVLIELLYQLGYAQGG